jgi:hypothetical protein
MHRPVCVSSFCAGFDTVFLRAGLAGAPGRGRARQKCSVICVAAFPPWCVTLLHFVRHRMPSRFFVARFSMVPGGVVSGRVSALQDAPCVLMLMLMLGGTTTAACRCAMHYSMYVRVRCVYHVVVFTASVCLCVRACLRLQSMHVYMSYFHAFPRLERCLLGTKHATGMNKSINTTWVPRHCHDPLTTLLRHATRTFLHSTALEGEEEEEACVPMRRITILDRGQGLTQKAGITEILTPSALCTQSLGFSLPHVAKPCLAKRCSSLRE